MHKEKSLLALHGDRTGASSSVQHQLLVTLLRKLCYVLWQRRNNQEKWLYIQTLVLNLKPGQLASSLLDGSLLLSQV